MIAAGAASGGVVAWSILSPAERTARMLLRRRAGQCLTTPFSQAGTHFTSYQAEQYPDLTYAAENAVKAVVNIEVVQEIEVPERQYDPFSNFSVFPSRAGAALRHRSVGAEDPA